MNHIVSYLPLIGLLAAVACSEAIEEEPTTRASSVEPALRVERTDSAAVEIATLLELAPLTDPHWRWTDSVRYAFDTQPAGAEPLLYNPVALLPMSGGRVAIVDGYGEKVVCILDTVASRVTRCFASRGEGPGEISSNVRLLPGPDDTFLVADLRLRKVLTFSPQGELVREERIPDVETILKSEVASDGGLLIETWEFDARAAPQMGVSRFDVSTGVLTDLLRLPQPADFTPRTGMRIQSGRPIWTAIGDHVVSMQSGIAHVKVHEQDGQLVRSIRLPLTNRRLSSAEITRHEERLGGRSSQFEPGEIAFTNALFPFTDTIFALYHSGLWKASEDEWPEDGETIWRLVGIDGVYHGAYLPGSFRPFWVENRRIWGVSMDSLGIPRIELRELIAPSHR